MTVLAFNEERRASPAFRGLRAVHGSVKCAIPPHGITHSGQVKLPSSTVGKPAAADADILRLHMSSPFGPVCLAAPLQFGVSSAMGALDVRLNLVQLMVGTAAPVRGTRKDSLLLPGSRNRGAAYAKFMETTATLLMAQVAAPRTTARTMHLLFALGMVTSLGQALAGTLENHIEAPGRSHQRLASRLRTWCCRGSGKRKARVARLRVPECLRRFLAPASTLSLAGPAMRRLLPREHHLVECLGALVAAFVGYAKTSRAAALGQIPTGAEGEKIWRRKHQQTARRLCHLLREYEPGEAPLAPVLKVLDRLLISAASLGSPCHPSLLSDAMGLPPNERMAAAVWGTLAPATRPQPGPPTTTVTSVPAHAHAWGTLSTTPSPASASVSPADHPVPSSASPPTTTALALQNTHPPPHLSSGAATPAMLVTASQGKEERLESGMMWLTIRAAYIAMVFLPMFLMAGIYMSLSMCLPGMALTLRFRRWMWYVLRWCAGMCGAAFIKWGQWASTREDMFPADFCQVLSHLHDKAPHHSLRYSKRAVRDAFGCHVEELFSEFSSKAVASGSIAQVHLAVLRPHIAASLRIEDEKDTHVAVKIRHPRVAEMIHQDFQILGWLASFTDRFQSLKFLNLKATLEQFSHTMTSQADLRTETENIMQISRNFAGLASRIVIPKVLPSLSSQTVLVETFESGVPVSDFLRKPIAGWGAQIVALGVDTYLKMLLQDNFVHTDLHPGNLLVRPTPRPSRLGPAPPSGASVVQAQSRQGEAMPAQRRQGEVETIQVVLLDFGLVETVSERVRRHFLSFLFLIGSGDAAGATRHLLQWGEKQTCPDPKALERDMKELFARECSLKERPIDLDVVMKTVLKLARKHEVKVDSSYAALVVGVCVLVGMASATDPNMCLMEAAVPCFLAYSMTGRVIGRLYG
ncbi:hypothetical protein CYMTET_23636 [Cymbomonas tetramitiformis]|uniref:ABC1 atypical kinase-like domain-containing protein n=1 Tax=Cymbomonas tetramitiformis TaxID=36881 RepID=A0AAE0FYX0_9CHLO|nr:hypothetical protein CYMTET_23636 [Cymbomonas tetramitiformis]